jgi:hypothetical protein
VDHVGTSKSVTDVRYQLVKLIDNDDGIFFVYPAGEAAWLMDVMAGGWLRRSR